MRKGQLTVEYLIILVIILMLFNSISLDLINESLEDALVIQTKESIFSARVLINSTISNLLLQGSGAAKTISLRAPPDCNYTVNAGSLSNITVNCLPESPSYNLDGLVIGPTVSGIRYNCTTSTCSGTGSIRVIGMNKLELVKIEKT